MKVFLVLAVLIAVALARPDGEHYDTKYDDFDVAALVGNKRLLESYAHCFLGSGACTPEGKVFKKVIPEALATNCGKCTPKQKHNVRVMIKAFQEQLPSEWEALTKEYDPEKKHTESFNTFINGTD